jgi:hypothetical protein
MKTTDSSILSSSINNKNNKWRYLIHLTFITILISLCIIIPIVNSLTGSPPYWTIIILSVVPFTMYVLLLIIIKRNNTTAATRTATNLPVADMEQNQDEITGLHRHIVEEDEEEEDDDDGVPSSMDNISYNPSTVGIPPSSFLAPTIHQQASIRSSSLDYIPPPPAYQDMIYPPSYRSTNSTKDDNVSVVY